MSDQFPPRRAEPGQRFVWRDALGVVYEATADDDGLLHPKNAGQERLADAFGLPVARKPGPLAKEQTAPAGAKEV